MKKEQVIELAKKADFSQGGGGRYEWDFMGDVEHMARFASLVEQATLERAAQACDEVEDKWESLHNANGEIVDEFRSFGALDCSEAIRNLAKDTQ